MRALTDKGKEKVHDIAIRYGLSIETVTGMLESIVYGGGTQAQFNLPELGGMGQWMKGGMIMVGDFFNHSLKNTVSNLCNDLSHLLQLPDIFVESKLEKNGEFIGTGTWWPSEYGSPSSSGAQNNMRYAYFSAPVRRLVIEKDGDQYIYDTLSYAISGVSQQQGAGQTLTFTSQQGPVSLESLPVVSKPSYRNERPVEKEAPKETEHTVAEPRIELKENIAPAAEKEDIFTTIERLGALLQKGLISESEFATKKTELLKRL